MPIDRENNGDPASSLQELGGVLRSPTPDQQRGTLANVLVRAADRIRGLNARFGIRPYRVFLIHMVWTDGAPGQGDARVASRIEILPVPRVKNLGAIDEVLRATGTVEEGDIEIDEVSARFTEEDLLGRTPDIRDPSLQRTSLEEMDFFWEVAENRPSVPQTIIRRFAVRGLPELQRDKFQWVVRLVKQDYNRGRGGETERDAP